MQYLDLAARRFRRAAVVDHVVRGLEATCAVDLRAQHCLCFSARNPIAPHQALELRGFRAIDDENAIDELAEARFDEQGHGHERIRRLEPFQFRSSATANQRMKDRFELSPFGVIGKYKRSQRRAIELARRQQHARPEFRGDGS